MLSLLVYHTLRLVLIYVVEVVDAILKGLLVDGYEIAIKLRYHLMYLQCILHLLSSV